MKSIEADIQHMMHLKHMIRDLREQEAVYQKDLDDLMAALLPNITTLTVYEELRKDGAMKVTYKVITLRKIEDEPCLFISMIPKQSDDWGSEYDLKQVEQFERNISLITEDHFYTTEDKDYFFKMKEENIKRIKTLNGQNNGE